MTTSAYKIENHQSEKGTWGLYMSMCKGCGLCIEKCPKKCLSWSQSLGMYGTPAVQPNTDECILCGMCQTTCPDCAIVVTRKAK